MIVPSWEVSRETDKEVRNGFAVVCDRCKSHYDQFHFKSEHEARDWIDGKDYMGFELPTCADRFHRVGSRLYCAHCTEKLIQATRQAKSDAEDARLGAPDPRFRLTEEQKERVLREASRHLQANQDQPNQYPE